MINPSGIAAWPQCFWLHSEFLYLAATCQYLELREVCFFNGLQAEMHVETRTVLALIWAVLTMPLKEGCPCHPTHVWKVLNQFEENISDFVAKKREMFLVQMSLDVKKAEILKLDARAKDKEEAGLLAKWVSKWWQPRRFKLRDETLFDSTIRLEI